MRGSWACGAYRCGVIAQPAPEKPIAVLSAVQSGVGFAALVITVLAVVLGGDGSVPTWLGLIVVALVSVIAVFSVRWYHRRPIRVGDFHNYQGTAIVRLAIAADPAVVGAVMTFVTPSVWPAVVGFAATIASLALAPVSAGDYERHQKIFIEENAEVPAEVWNTADPSKVAPWDQLEEGHGHGMSH